MAKNDLVLLDSIIDEYIQNKRPSENCGEVFEFFATEQILKNYAFSEQQILSGSVDGRNDGGIDEFFVLVNGHLAEGIPLWLPCTARRTLPFRRQAAHTRLPAFSGWAAL